VHTSLLRGLHPTLLRETSLSALPATVSLIESMAHSGPSPNTYHLSLHLQFLDTYRPVTLSTLDWLQSVVTLATIPNIRHPIKLYISHGRRTVGADVLSAIEQDPEMEQLTKAAKVQIENGPVYFDSHGTTDHSDVKKAG
jgi:hypothetical protein